MEPETTDETLKSILDDTLTKAEKDGIYLPNEKEVSGKAEKISGLVSEDYLGYENEMDSSKIDSIFAQDYLEDLEP